VPGLLTATHCNTLQHTATYCNTLQHTATHVSTGVPRLLTATHCNTLQHTATHGNTLQHTTLHCNTRTNRSATTSVRCASGETRKRGHQHGGCCGTHLWQHGMCLTPLPLTSQDAPTSHEDRRAPLPFSRRAGVCETESRSDSGNDSRK